jgi:hypothetical protein
MVTVEEIEAKTELIERLLKLGEVDLAIREMKELHEKIKKEKLKEIIE